MLETTTSCSGAEIFSSGRIPAASRGNSTHRDSTAACPSSSINTQLSAQVAEIMRQGMASARGSTAPPSEACTYMTAVSDATALHKQFLQSPQRVDELERELAKMQTPSSVNTANAFPFSNYGYNVEYCPDMDKEVAYVQQAHRDLSQLLARVVPVSSSTGPKA